MMNPKKLKTVNILSLLFILLLYVFTAEAQLSWRIENIITRKDLAKVDFAILIVDAQSGRELYSHQPRKAMIPASNMKLVSTALALRMLGPKYSFDTTVGYYQNNLIIFGGGDPLLGGADSGKSARQVIDEIAGAVMQNGITDINSIIVDTSIFDGQVVHPSWPADQLNRSYACEVSGLNFNYNCVQITASNNAGRVILELEPQTDYLSINNTVKPLNKGESAIGSYRSPRPNEITIFGKCNKTTSFELAIEQPAGLLASMLAKKLADCGAASSGITFTVGQYSGPKPMLICKFQTPIAAVIKKCNTDSHGLSAECLLKVCAAERHGRPGSWYVGTRMSGVYLSRLGVDSSEYVINDASGLSKLDRLSPNAIVAVIKDIYGEPAFRDIFVKSLAVSGVSGTIERYFRDEKYSGKIFGKTGYIAGVKSFSGICRTSLAGDIIFSIITNNANGNTRPAINEIASAIIDEYDSVGK